MDNACETSLPRPRPPAQRGFTLVVALVMLAAIGLASAAVMRNASGAAQAAANDLLQGQAAQWAQLALGFCEKQLTVGAQVRTVPVLPPATPAAWTQRARWTAGAGQAYTLQPKDIGSAAALPRFAPQCLVEGPSRPDVYTVTARGFSPDFRAAAVSDALGGSVVWLQSTVLLEDVAQDAEACARHCAAVRQRLWQRLLTPPF